MASDSDSSVAPLLLQWGLDALSIQRFMDEDYTIPLLKFLSQEDIRRLLPRAGPRGLFAHHFNLWMASQPSSSSTTTVPPPPPVHLELASLDEPEQEASISEANCTRKYKLLSVEPGEPSVNSLHALLKSTPEGKAVIAFFNLKQKLNDQFRDLLAERIIYGEISDNLDKRIDAQRFEELSELLVELFPSESKDTWFEVSTKRGRKITTARLRHKFYNIRRMYIKVGLIKRSVVADELDDDEGLGSDGELEDDELLWLKEHDSPWTEVLLKWNLSVTVRRRIFSRSKCISDIVSLVPALRKQIGHSLLIEDFNREHPDLTNLVETHWPRVIQYFRTLIQEKEPDFLEGVTTETGADVVQVLCNLAYVFKPRTHKSTVVDKEKLKVLIEQSKAKATKGKKKKIEQPTLLWRPSRSEVQQAFAVRIDEIGSLKGLVEGRQDLLKRFGFTLQPFVVLIGPDCNIRQSLIVLDDIIWECNGPLEAVDSLFKIFNVLNCSYPIEARHIWLTIQQSVYKIFEPHDFSGTVGLKSFVASYVKDITSLLKD